jgi:hypothetical protein
MASELCSYWQAPATCRCTGCKKHVYCNTDHQRKDWDAQHKHICKDLQLETLLPWAASLIKKTWLAFLKHRWTRTIAKIEVNSNEVVVHEGTKARGALVVAFPNHLLQDEHAKNATLCDKSSPLAPMAVMQPLVARIFNSKHSLVRNT